MSIRQDQDRTELQERLETELQARAKKRTELADKTPDGVDDSRYVEGFKKTTSLSWIWMAIIVIAIGIFIWLVTLS